MDGLGELVRTRRVRLNASTAAMSFGLLLALPFSGDVTVSKAPFQLGILGPLSPRTGLPTPGPCAGCQGPP